MERITKDNRLMGLAHAVFFGGITYISLKMYSSPLVDIPMGSLGTLLVLDGLADLVTGEHRYLPNKALEYFENRRSI